MAAFSIKTSVLQKNTNLKMVVIQFSHDLSSGESLLLDG